MSDTCYCRNASRRCHDCLVTESERLYPYKDYPIRPYETFLYAMIPAALIAFIVGPEFFFVGFIAFIIPCCGMHNIVGDDKEYQEEYQRVKEYNKYMDECRDNYVEGSDSCCTII